jgi:hypothetical protein
LPGVASLIAGVAIVTGVRLGGGGGAVGVLNIGFISPNAADLRMITGESVPMILTSKLSQLIALILLKICCFSELLLLCLDAAPNEFIIKKSTQA